MDFVVSDHHFNHTNIITYCSRPYRNAGEMNEDMIQRWNAVVKPEDTVYHLGDFAFGSPESAAIIAGRLNGKIRIILGNHDRHRLKVYLDDCKFEVLGSDYDRSRFEYSSAIIMTHRPWHDSSNRVNIHGHTHNNKDTPISPKYINVSVEAINYTPVPIQRLLEMLG